MQIGSPGWALGEITDSYSWLYRPAFSHYRTPGQYNPGKNNVADLAYVAMGSREYIHASVRLRERGFKRSMSLAGFDIVTDGEAGKDELRLGLKWVKKVGENTVEIPEMRIMGGERSAELDLVPENTREELWKGTRFEAAEPSLLD